MPKIRLSDVSVSIDGHDILTQINLELTEQRIGIIGANGGGKSTPYPPDQWPRRSHFRQRHRRRH